MDYTSKHKNPPSFLQALTTLLLGVMLVGLGIFYLLFISYYGAFTVVLGVAVFVYGTREWKQFQKTLPEDSDETLAEKKP